jgi:hypothetical protein
MIDFGLGTTLAPAATPTVAVRQVAPVVTEQVKVTPVASAAVAYAMKSEDVWGWSDLRDFVIREIEQRHGPQVRDPKKEASIFKSFMSRWPEQAVGIAKAAFGPVYDGMWRNAPISVNRFCKASDEYFAAVIAERL